MTFSDSRSPDDAGTTAPPREAIDRRAERILKQSGYSALREVVCEAQEGLIHLSGCMRSHFLKQIAQATVSRIEGVHGVINRIKVNVPGPAHDSDKTAPLPDRR